MPALSNELRHGESQYSHDVKVRLLALGLAVWGAANAWVYVGAGVVPSLLVAAGLPSRSMLICSAVILGIAGVLALPSIGMLMLPGVIAAAAVAVLSPRRD